MRSELGDKVRLLHILDAIRDARNFVRDINFEEFASNAMMWLACVKALEIIGEASNHISDRVKDRFSDVEWNQMIGMRNILVHQYFDADRQVVWRTIQDDLPSLEEKVERILATL